MAEKCLLKWTQFQDNAISTFMEQRSEDLYTDVTLVAEDNTIMKAHRVILTASCEYFAKLLRAVPNATSVFCLDGVSHSELEYLLEFIYKGEIQIPNEIVPRFIELSKRFSIKGIKDISLQDKMKDNINPPDKHQIPTGKNQVLPDKYQIPANNYQIPANNYQVPAHNYQVPSDNNQVQSDNFLVPAERERNPKDNDNLPKNEQEPIEDYLKSKISAYCKIIENEIKVNAHEVSEGILELDENVLINNEEAEKHFQTPNSELKSESVFPNNQNGKDRSSLFQNKNLTYYLGDSSFSYDEFKKYIVQLFRMNNNGYWECNICSNVTSNKSHMREHVEKHLKNMFIVCNICGRKMKRSYYNRARQHTSTCSMNL